MANNGEAAKNTDERPNFDRRMPDFGQPDEQADIRGFVVDVVGNQIKILKIERPQNGEGRPEGMPDFQGELEGDAKATESAEQTTRTLGSMGGAMGGRPGGGFMRGGNREMDEDAQAQMIERLKSMSSGEEEITIPVGIKMLKPDTESDSKEPNMIEASLSDVKTNTMLTVWLNDEVTDRNVAEFVMVMGN